MISGGQPDAFWQRHPLEVYSGIYFIGDSILIYERMEQLHSFVVLHSQPSFYSFCLMQHKVQNANIQLHSIAVCLLSSRSFLFPKISVFLTLSLLHFFHASGSYYSAMAGLMFTWLQPWRPGREQKIARDCLAQQPRPEEQNILLQT